jgi:hypothetical protein
MTKRLKRTILNAKFLANSILFSLNLITEISFAYIFLTKILRVKHSLTDLSYKNNGINSLRGFVEASKNCKSEVAGSRLCRGTIIFF